jgi:hypothetical protein
MRKELLIYAIHGASMFAGANELAIFENNGLAKYYGIARDNGNEGDWVFQTPLLKKKPIKELEIIFKILKESSIVNRFPKRNLKTDQSNS